MRESSLTLNQFKEYCDLLTKKGLLNYDPVNGIYKITQKGQRFISAYDKLFDLLLDTKGGQSDPISSVESVESIERYSGKFPSSE